MNTIRDLGKALLVVGGPDQGKWRVWPKAWPSGWMTLSAGASAPTMRRNGALT